MSTIPEMKLVESSNVEAVGHDGSDLYVRFKGGGVYVYAGVPVDLYEKLLADKSVGRFLNSCIKGSFECQKIAGKSTEKDHVQPLSAWQTMDSAPKGVRILVWETWPTGSATIAQWIGEPHNYWCKDSGGSVAKPSHWQKLPEGPDA